MTIHETHNEIAFAIVIEASDTYAMFYINITQSQKTHVTHWPWHDTKGNVLLKQYTGKQLHNNNDRS